MKPLFLGGGVTGSDYRANISVIFTNFFFFFLWNIEIKKGDRIAQIVFHKKEKVDFEEVNEFDDKTCQGSKGFGWTGLTPTSCYFH